MPDIDGYVLPHEQQNFRIQRTGNSTLADEVLDIAFYGHNRPEYFHEFSLFSTADTIFSEAIECYRCGLFEAAMILCRTTIESVLYISKYLKVLEAGRGTLGWTSTDSGELAESSWNLLKTHAITDLNFDENVIERIYNDIWDRYGNFCAHLPNRQRREQIEFGNLTEDQRLQRKAPLHFILDPEAGNAMKETAEFLVAARRKGTEKAMLLYEASRQGPSIQ